MGLVVEQWRAVIGEEARYHFPQGCVCTQQCDKLTSKSAACFWKRGRKLPHRWFMSSHHSHRRQPTRPFRTALTLNGAITLNLKPNHLIVFALNMTHRNMQWSLRMSGHTGFLHLRRFYNCRGKGNIKHKSGSVMILNPHTLLLIDR